MQDYAGSGLGFSSSSSFNSTEHHHFDIIWSSLEYRGLCKIFFLKERIVQGFF